MWQRAACIFTSRPRRWSAGAPPGFRPHRMPIGAGPSSISTTFCRPTKVSIWTFSLDGQDRPFHATTIEHDIVGIEGRNHVLVWQDFHTLLSWRISGGTDHFR